MTVPHLLEARGLSKNFGGVVALDHLDLAVAPNEILGLIGPNGSGKTTFFNVATGIYGADGGTVTFDGAEITRAALQAIYHAGISRTFQRSRLSLPLSIFDNIMIGNHKRLSQGLWFNLMRRGAFKREFEASYLAARALVEVFEPQLAERMFEPVAGLPMIDRRRIEICRALVNQPKLLLLDEPSAGRAVPSPRPDDDPGGAAADPVLEAIRPLERGATALDIGCGAGMDLLLAARRVGAQGRAIGVDMTPEMRQQARAGAVQCGFMHVEVREGDATALPVDDESVDVVISNGVLNLVPDKQAAIAEIRRVLKPGGRVQIADIVLGQDLPESARRDVELWTG